MTQRGRAATKTERATSGRREQVRTLSEIVFSDPNAVGPAKLLRAGTSRAPENLSEKTRFVIIVGHGFHGFKSLRSVSSA